MQGKGARAHTHAHIHTRVCEMVLQALTDAIARLLEFLPIEEGPVGQEMSSIFHRVIESNIFDVSHCRRSELEVCYRGHGTLDSLHKSTRVNMDGDHYICRPCLAWHCCATEKCNKFHIIIIIAT